MIHHVAFEVADLERSGRFYDAVLFALGGRRTYESADTLGWGRDGSVFWLTSRARPRPEYGHVAFAAAGRAAVRAAWEAGVRTGGTSDGGPGPRPEYGPTYYAAYLLDPDGLKVEIVAGA